MKTPKVDKLSWIQVLSLLALGDLPGARATIFTIAKNELQEASELKWESYGGPNELRMRFLALNVVACMVQARAPLATKNELRRVMASFEKSTDMLRKRSVERQARMTKGIAK